MNYEHGSIKPENFKEDWDGQFKILPWMAYVSAIPHVIYLITTLKADGTPNAGLQGWSSFSGEGDNFFALISGILKRSHTYGNIVRDGEFCINFLPPGYLENFKKSISENSGEINEIVNSGFTQENSKTISVPRIKESFLKLECSLEWTKDLVPNGINAIVCGRVNHISAAEDFCRKNVSERYDLNCFTFHLMAMKNPFTGQRIRGGIGRVELVEETEL
ncbi:MAG: flavin reductase [Spirochaetales bacterium]|nr:flavin reductase [Spirochaetales bacterium]